MPPRETRLCSNWGNSFRHSALGYFLHRDRVRRQTAGGFLQTSLSKILGDRDPSFYLNMARLGFPMNASGFTSTGVLAGYMGPCSRRLDTEVFLSLLSNATETA